MKKMMILTVTLFDNGKIQTQIERDDEVNPITQTVISLGMLSAASDAINFTMKKEFDNFLEKEPS